MATLKIGDKQKDVAIPEETCRDIRKSLRKQVGKPAYFESTNRRCSLKPTKLPDGEPEGYYLKRKPERGKGPQHLETIYEEPQVRKNGEVKLLGAKKSRRIMFRTVAKAKTKRKKGPCENQRAGGLKRSRKMTMDEFIKQMRAVTES